jgi:hypothetical protein
VTVDRDRRQPGDELPRRGVTGGGQRGGVVTVSFSAFTTARILGSRTVHQVAGPVTGGLQRTVCGLTRRLMPTPADPASCRHCLRLTGATRDSPDAEASPSPAGRTD